MPEYKYATANGDIVTAEYNRGMALSNEEVKRELQAAFECYDKTVSVESVSSELPEVFRANISDSATSSSVIICAKGTTPGGRNALMNEQRIQQKVKYLNYAYNENRKGNKAVSLGVYKNEEVVVFCAWKLAESNAASEETPISKQIKIETIAQAIKNGFAQQNKGRGEYACAFRRELIYFYLDNCEWLHTGPVTELNEHIEVSEDESTEQYSPQWFREKALEFPNYDDEADTYRNKFLNRYAPEKLEALEGIDLLRGIFLNDDNKDNLCYELEYNKEGTRLFGGIGGGTAAKYGLYFNKKLYGWVKGRKEELSDDEAIEYGAQIRDELVEGAKIVMSYSPLDDRKDYFELYKKLFDVTGGNINRVWFLKYYQIIRPEAFPPIFGDNAQRNVLTTIGIKPEENSLERMSQMKDFASECGISNVLFSHIFWTYCANNQTPEDEESNISVDVEENEQRFREWMSLQVTTSGSAPTQSTISNNCHALKEVCKRMDIIEYPELESLFEITDLDTYLDIKDIIRGHHDFAEVNEAIRNRYLGSSMKWYEKYLNDIYEDYEEEEQEEVAEPYGKDDFLKKVFFDADEYDDLYKLMMYKKNVILQGAPGVGKTFLAKRFAYSVIGSKSDKYIEVVQFHQNYSYEDFIMGYKPTDDGFELKTGVFYNFCEKARKDSDHKYFFIIDEINRGNLSKIFGELMMLIEGDKRGEDNQITLAYRNEQFYVPENVYLIGMMNTADRSLAMMDYALRRRFSFFDVEPAFDKPSFKKYIEDYIKDSNVVNKVIDRFKDLNAKIADEETSGLGKGFCIGHSYFCNPPVDGQSDQEWYDTIIKYEVSPLLDEYWWDDKNKADDCKEKLVKE
ncbi:MAG: AAA family ATPase [Anaerovoracaceae bacterium]